MAGKLAPFLSGALRPISITCAPCGAKAALPPAGSATFSTMRMVIMSPVVAERCSSQRAAISVETPSRRSASVPWLATVRYSAPVLALAAVARAQGWEMVRVPAVISWADARVGDRMAALDHKASARPKTRAERRVTGSTDGELQET